MRFDALIFDFNGVLWWDNHLQEQAWKRFSARLRGTPFSDEEMSIHVHGRNNQHTLEYLIGHAVERDRLCRLTQQKEAIYRRLCLAQGEQFQLSPGAIELLGFLVDHQIPHTIATASERTNLHFFVEHLNLDVWFEVEQIVHNDGSRPGKPAPDIYLQAARNLGVLPERSVVVEDSRAGIRAARAAGIGYIIALGPPHLHDCLARLEGVSRVIEDLYQVPPELFH